MLHSEPFNTWFQSHLKELDKIIDHQVLSQTWGRQNDKVLWVSLYRQESWDCKVAGWGEWRAPWRWLAECSLGAGFHSEEPQAPVPWPSFPTCCKSAIQGTAQAAGAVWKEAWLMAAGCWGFPGHFCHLGPSQWHYITPASLIFLHKYFKH